MAKQQSRRSISVRGDTYRKLQSHCAALGVSVSGWLEIAIATKMNEERDRYGELSNDPRGTKATGV